MANGTPPKKGLRFSPEINAGHILTAVMLLFGIVGGYAAFHTRLSVLEFRQAQTDQVVNELKNNNVKLAQSIEELKTISIRLTVFVEESRKSKRE
jgi:uncharacterized coiled-coil protein SlyX